MHEPDEILPKYMLKFHLRPTQTQTQTNKMGDNLIKKIKNKKFQEFKFFPTLSKIYPTLEIVESKV